MSQESPQTIFSTRMEQDHGQGRKNAPEARKSVSLSDVPPWRYLRPGLPLELAALLAGDELGLDDVGRLTLLWQFRSKQTGQTPD